MYVFFRDSKRLGMLEHNITFWIYILTKNMEDISCTFTVCHNATVLSGKCRLFFTTILDLLLFCLLTLSSVHIFRHMLVLSPYFQSHSSCSRSNAFSAHYFYICILRKHKNDKFLFLSNGQRNEWMEEQFFFSLSLVGNGIP